VGFRLRQVEGVEVDTGFSRDFWLVFEFKEFAALLMPISLHHYGQAVDNHIEKAANQHSQNHTHDYQEAGACL
jgi:hypothetical protein